VVPVQVAAHVREDGVDLVVGAIPPLRLRHRHPAADLAPLGVDPGQPVVEHARDTLLDRVCGAAGHTAKRIGLVLERPSADLAAPRVECGGAPMGIPTQPPYTAPLRLLDG